LDGFGRLSAESRQARFLIRKDELTDAEVRYFTDVDHHDHEAIVALSAADGRGVGVARFVRAVDDDQAAEVAVTVVDDWQRRGLGAVLLRQLLERALQEGIRRFTALIDDSNTAMRGLLRSLGVQSHVLDREFGATSTRSGLMKGLNGPPSPNHVQQRVRRPATSGSQARAADGAIFGRTGRKASSCPRDLESGPRSATSIRTLPTTPRSTAAWAAPSPSGSGAVKSGVATDVDGAVQQRVMTL
jgi:GNAT superfamily N-acetyltransferase